ncbi:helix-turn-helix domain-containing protein [Streptomyces sp. NPDC002328]|uniref:helix-turn-helix domain-containing protein n=1 Tax=Streptomyces sp. NPDC002328 TaxID=3364642 RepID=UPI003694EA18
MSPSPPAAAAGDMGRPAKPVAAGTSPRLRALAVYLRQLKDDTRTTYATLSERTGPPGAPGYRGASTLSQAARGTHLPPLETVLAYARAAGDPGSHPTQRREATALSLWKAAAIEKARPHLAGRSRRTRQVRTPASLGQELTRLRLRPGRPSYSAIEKATKADGHRVPRSTAHLILNGTVLPSREQLSALLKAFDVSVVDAAQWHAVLDRIEDRRRPPEPIRRGRGYACADADPAVQEYLERRERDEEIKRRTGQIHPDETYEDYEERMRERAFQQQTSDDWLTRTATSRRTRHRDKCGPLSRPPPNPAEGFGRARHPTGQVADHA